MLVLFQKPDTADPISTIIKRSVFKNNRFTHVAVAIEGVVYDLTIDGLASYKFASLSLYHRRRTNVLYLRQKLTVEDVCNTPYQLSLEELALTIKQPHNPKLHSCCGWVCTLLGLSITHDPDELYERVKELRNNGKTYELSKL